VSFSGGRDSSAILAVAVHVARREGLPMPIPVTSIFPECDDTEESHWQEMVIRHLRVDDWQRLAFTDEIDMIGPYSQTVLLRHGLLWPAQAHFLLPITEQASGGAVLTGFGGDELLDPGWAWQHANMLLSRRIRPRPRHVRGVVAALGPRTLQRAVLRRRLIAEPPLRWLRPEAHREIMRQRVEAALLESVRWDTSVRRSWWPTRYRRAAVHTYERLIAEGQAIAVHPLCEGGFLAAITHERGWKSFASRSEAMEWLVGDLLPLALLTRSSKAGFNGAFWNRHSRAFAARWDGSGVDESLVDPAVLREMFTGDEPPDARTLSLFQSIWLVQLRQPHA
jgi:asparagine synthase (glutamine-hydrolysing)